MPLSALPGWIKPGAFPQILGLTAAWIENGSGVWVCRDVRHNQRHQFGLVWKMCVGCISMFYVVGECSVKLHLRLIVSRIYEGFFFHYVVYKLIYIKGNLKIIFEMIFCFREDFFSDFNIAQICNLHRLKLTSPHRHRYY